MSSVVSSVGSTMSATSCPPPVNLSSVVSSGSTTMSSATSRPSPVDLSPLLSPALSSESPVVHSKIVSSTFPAIPGTTVMSLPTFRVIGYCKCKTHCGSHTCSCKRDGYVCGCHTVNQVLSRKRVRNFFSRPLLNVFSSKSDYNLKIQGSIHYK